MLGFFRSPSTTLLVASVATACETSDLPPEVEPDAPELGAPRNGPIWSDCESLYTPLPPALDATRFGIAAVILNKGPDWAGLCAADEACEAAVAVILTEMLVDAMIEIEDETEVLAEIRAVIVELAFNANFFQLGAPGQLQIIGAAFMADLAFTAAGAVQQIPKVVKHHSKAQQHLSAAVGVAYPHLQIRTSVADTLNPINAAFTALLVPIGAYTTCVATELAKMNAVAAQVVAVGPGPFGGFQPPAGGGGGGAPLTRPGPGVVFMRTDDDLQFAAATRGQRSDPYAPLFGPTNPWQGMPTITANFSTGPLADDAYAMKRCEAPGDNCGPIYTDPICEAALDGGPDCQVWASYRQLWFTYSLPEGIPDSPRVLSAIDDSCPNRPEGAICGVGMAPYGRCRGGECEIVPEGTPLCAAARGYGPYPAETEVQYSCDAIECPPDQCLIVATQNAAFQYNLGQFPVNITCDRMTPQGYAGGLVRSGETVGCRVTFRTDGPPEAAGQLRSAQFRVIHVDVQEAWSDDPALHIEQNFEVTWTSEVPPSNCYDWDSYEKKWRYSYWSCSNGDDGGDDDGGSNDAGSGGSDDGGSSSSGGGSDDGGVFTSGNPGPGELGGF